MKRCIIFILFSMIALSANADDYLIMNFSEGTNIRFCNSQNTLQAAIKAVGEENYLLGINRLGALQKERLCTAPLDMSKSKDFKVKEVYRENDDENGRLFVIASHPRSLTKKCEACNNLRESENLYFIAYNDLGGGQFGWKSYIQFIIQGRTIGGIFDFLTK